MLCSRIARTMFFASVILLALTMLIPAGRVAASDKPPPDPLSSKITEIRTQLEVYEKQKEGGVVVVELHLGDVIRRWKYGVGAKWEVGFFTRFVHAVDVNTGGKKPRVYVEVRDSRGAAPGIKAQVFLFFANGQAQEFHGNQLFDTVTDGNALELTRKNDPSKDPGRNPLASADAAAAAQGRQRPRHSKQRGYRERTIFYETVDARSDAEDRVPWWDADDAAAVRQHCIRMDGRDQSKARFWCGPVQTERQLIL